jgi:hypothetical protein
MARHEGFHPLTVWSARPKSMSVVGQQGRALVAGVEWQQSGAWAEHGYLIADVRTAPVENVTEAQHLPRSFTTGLFSTFFVRTAKLNEKKIINIAIP